MRVMFQFRILVKIGLRVQERCRIKVRINVSFESGLDLS